MVKCKTCFKTYSTISSLNRHLRETHWPKKICPYCFDFYGRLNSHLKSCKRYHNYQFMKLKIMGGEIYFIDEAKKSKQISRSKISQIKKGKLVKFKKFNN